MFRNVLLGQYNVEVSTSQVGSSALNCNGLVQNSVTEDEQLAVFVLKMSSQRGDGYEDAPALDNTQTNPLPLLSMASGTAYYSNKPATNPAWIQLCRPMLTNREAGVPRSFQRLLCVEQKQVSVCIERPGRREYNVTLEHYRMGQERST